MSAVVESRAVVFETSEDDLQFLASSLQGTSRTFALAIPLLGAELRYQVGIAYLLFRVADSIEDAAGVSADHRHLLLCRLRACLVPGEGDGKSGLSAVSDGFGGLWPAGSATEKLMVAAPRLLGLFHQLSPAAACCIRSALDRTIGGMLDFLSAGPARGAEIRVETVAELRLYCYFVAGIVGEMLTELFLLESAVPVEQMPQLRELAVGFGEFLQLVNILKDSEGDVRLGRCFIPTGVSRDTVILLAESSGTAAREYISRLESLGASGDVLAFCRFISRLAAGSLEALRQRGAGAKLSRGDVYSILESVRSSRDSV
jgi:farnesyl-diphosphate farnesyltransferase